MEEQIPEFASETIPSVSGNIRELSADRLTKSCDPSSLSFANTNELPDLQNVIGQPRALRALELGSQVSGPGYNIFVFGQPSSGRTTLTQEYLIRKAADEPVPDDWCYVFSFKDAHKPLALRLPAGRGVEFRKAIQEFILFCQNEIPRVFESEEYIQERDRLVNELKKNQEAEFIRLQEYVEKYKFAVIRTPFGIVLAPVIEGKPLTTDEVQSLSAEQRSKYEELQLKLGEEVEKSLNRLREMARSANQQVEELNRHTAEFLISPMTQSLHSVYADLHPILEHLDNLQADIIKNANKFHPRESGESGTPPEDQSWLWRYDINVVVDNSNQRGAPVILESQPSYYNLLGRIEHTVVMGATRTDFTMIRAGAIHRANGGYLILSARDLLINAYAWEGVKRVLRDGVIRIIELGNQLGLLSTESLEPEPIPVDIKVILVGTPLLYYLLRQYDEDFTKLFKVRAEFATMMERNPQTEHEYGLFVKSVVDDNQLPNFDNTAVARVIDFSSRLAEHQDKLSTRFGKISDLIREAAYWAIYDGKNHRLDKTPSEIGNIVVSASAVDKAIQEGIYRSNLLEERLQELITDQTIMIDVIGQAIGQINALSVLSVGDHSFGRPSKVTASVYPGKAGVIDIERQADLGGPIHTKGVLIISGYLGARYGYVQPLNLSASLTFEQSYDEIEGDSASAAELIALLSAIARLPIRQDCAITGSVNQHGQIQAIGGVNEKIEGFFAACKVKGITGSQGVLIPASNIRHLMLGSDVVEAVQNGLFHIWPIETVNEGLRLLTDLEPGEIQSDGRYPINTFNDQVIKSLEKFARSLSVEPTKKPKARRKKPDRSLFSNQSH